MTRTRMEIVHKIICPLVGCISRIICAINAIIAGSVVLFWLIWFEPGNWQEFLR